MISFPSSLARLLPFRSFFIEVNMKANDCISTQPAPSLYLKSQATYWACTY